MAIEIFLKVTGQKQGLIQGESTDAAHKNEISGLSFSWGEVAPSDPQSGLPTGKRQVQPLTFSMPTCKASPLLLNAMVNSENLTQFILTCRKPGVAGTTGKSPNPADNLVYTITNARITKFHTHANDKGSIQGLTSPAGTGTVPTAPPALVDELTFTFQKISMSYKSVDATGVAGGAVVGSDDWETAV